MYSHSVKLQSQCLFVRRPSQYKFRLMSCLAVQKSHTKSFHLCVFSQNSEKVVLDMGLYYHETFFAYPPELPSGVMWIIELSCFGKIHYIPINEADGPI